MKIIYLIILFLTLVDNFYGQQRDSLIAGEKLPKGLTISVDHVNHPTAFMDRKCIGAVEFSDMKKSVTYYVYEYTLADSLAFSKILRQRIAMENCSWRGNKNSNKNFRTYFIKGGYYFLLEFCPCGASSRGRCGNLAMKINNWLKES